MASEIYSGSLRVNPRCKYRGDAVSPFPLYKLSTVDIVYGKYYAFTRNSLSTANTIRE